MKHFKAYGQILWKRNALWLILFGMLAILFQGIMTKNHIENKVYVFHKSIETIQTIYEHMDEDADEIMENIYANWSNIKQNRKEVITAYQDKEKVRALEKQSQDQFYQILEKWNYSIEDLEEFELPEKNRISEKDSLKMELLEFYENYIKNHEKDYPYGLKINFSQEIFSDSSMIWLVFILGFLLMSMEHLTPYYEFSRMLPWSHGRIYGMKVLFGGLYLGILYALSVGIKLIFLKTSFFSEIIYYDGFGAHGMSYLFYILGIFFIVMGTGAVAGNVIGHLGMIVLAFLGLEVVHGNLLGLLSVFHLEKSAWILKLGESFAYLPKIIQVLLKPYMGLNTYSMGVRVWYLALVGCIYLLLGYYWTLKSKSERTGMLILKKSVSHFAQFFAVLTSAVFVDNIFRYMGLGWIRIGIFALVLYIAYKFYKMLFKVRIGL